MLEGWKNQVNQLKVETYALYIACKDPEVPWYAKACAACVVGYALSPIDLIPDFIPVLGYLDDLVVVPLGIMLTLKMIPAPVMARCRTKARVDLSGDKHMIWLGAGIIIAIWLLLLAIAIAILIRIPGHSGTPH